ncbi:MAG: hypothetical protein AAF493_04870 [Pseudomonadota bacterium]
MNIENMKQSSQTRRGQRVARAVRAILGSAALVASLGPQATYADNQTVFAGAGCHTRSTLATRGTHINGTFLNVTSNPVDVDCPLAAHNTQNTQGTSYVVVTFARSLSAANSDPARCTLRSWAHDGSLLSTSVRTSIGKGRISLIPMVTQSGVSGRYSLNCTVPARSILYSYHVRERGIDN